MTNLKAISVNKLLIFILYLLISTMLILSIGQNDLNRITYLSLFQLLINIIVLIYYGYSIFSLPILFLVFSYAFHFGQIIIYTFNVDVETPFEVVANTDFNILIKACNFFMLSQIFLVIGIMISNFKEIPQRLIDPQKSEEQKYITYIIGVILFFVGLIPRLYIDINKFILYSSGNYLSTYNLNIYGALTIIAGFVQVGILMILVGLQDKKRKATVIFFIAIIYQGVMMLTGGRQDQVTYIVALVFLYLRLIKTIRFRATFVWLIFAYFGIKFINFIGTIRLSTSKNIIDLWNSYNQSNTSPILASLSEFGGTMISLIYSVTYFPNYNNYNMGMSYLQSLLSIFPNIGGVLDGFQKSFLFTQAFPRSAQAYLGGSYLGELYYNFGTFGVICTLFVGLFIGFVSLKVNESIKNQKWISLSVYMIFFPIILLWVRGYFSDMVREFVWTSVMIIFLYKILKSKKYES